MNLTTKFFIIGASLCQLTACQTSSIRLFNNGSESSAERPPPTAPDRVLVYRTQHPFDAFTEVGLISFRTNYLSLTSIYDQIRRDSAIQGAEAVIDVKIKGETHMEPEQEQRCEPKTVCDSNGCTTNNECHFETVWRNVSTFTTEGSMIRRKNP